VILFIIFTTSRRRLEFVTPAIVDIKSPIPLSGFYSPYPDQESALLQ
jgi:hypothetical protein